MDHNENESLRALERLLEEFFHPNATNMRKYEIEVQLNQFKTSPHLWKLSLFFIRQTTSQYVTMFALSTLESVICQQWSTTEEAFKEEIKHTLQNYLVEKGAEAPHFLRGKYAKLLVEIAKRDWPDRFPTFFPNILELLKSECNQLIGLILLRTASEEFMGHQASTFESCNRKEEYLRLMQYIPVIFELLTNILENLGTKPRHPTTATPPPSPTHPTALPNFTQQLVTATFRPDRKALNKEALNTVQHLFTWVSVTQIPPRIIKAIFNFTNISSYAQDDDDTCVLAMSTVNELLYRKCTPPGSHTFFVQLYHHTVDLLRDISGSTPYRLDSLDPSFVEKLSELLVLLIEQHLWRLESEPSFSALNFLSLLYQLTMQLPSVQCYLRCLAVWVAFIKQIKPLNAHKYSEVFLGLITGLIKKIQYNFNGNQLNSINFTEVDDDNQTEWQIFLKTSIEVIAMVAEYAAIDTFNHVLIPWKNTHDIYRQLESAFDHQNHSLNIENSETERLCHTLRDFCTLTQTLARLSSLFLDQDNDEANCQVAILISNLLEKLLESASMATNIRFYNLKIPNWKLMEVLNDIHSELLAALKTWLLWMSQNDKLTEQNLRALVYLTLPILHDGDKVPVKISHAASQLLLSLTSLVFAPNLLVFPEILQFIHLVPNLRFANSQTGYLVYSAITNLLLRPWGELNQEDSNHRTVLVQTFFDGLTRDFRDLHPNTHLNEVKIIEIVTNSLSSLSHIIEFCKNFPIVSKKQLCTAIKSSIDNALLLFPTFVKFPEANNQILNFYLNILGVLQQQVGVEFVKQAVQIFLQVVSKQQTNLSGLDKLLQILQLIVEAPGNSYKTFLEGILQLCMENVYPMIVAQANEHPDVFLALLSLLYSVLLHRWQYFYLSQVRLGYSPGCSESEIGPDSPQKPEQLLAVLQVFGQALLQQDINIFRLSLAALEDLNTKWKLYHKALFRDHLLNNFLTVLIQSLVDKTHQLLSEDVQIGVYNMAAVNFNEFFTTFLHSYIQTLKGMSSQQWETLLRTFVENHDTDMPTFIQHLQRFVNEAQHYQRCNASSGFVLS